MWKKFNSIYAVLKIAEVCNLDCPYCYFFYGGDESFLRRPKFITEKTIEDVGAFLAEGVHDYGIPRISISFHGGEPLLFGKERFIQMCRILHRHISPHAQLVLSMQTNATLIDPEWIDIISAYEIGVGISLDGPAHINDVLRINKNGKGSHAAIVKGIQQLNAAHDKGLIRGFAVNCVVTQNSNAKEIFSHFVDELGIKTFDLSSPIMDWGHYDEKGVEFITKFYKELLELWIARNDPGIRIGIFSDMLTALLSDQGAERYDRMRSHAVPTFTIRSDGGLCPDDALAPKSESYSETHFFVNNNSLRAFLEAEFWRDIHVAYLLPDGDCEACKWAGLCGGGLPEHRFTPGKGFARKSTYCETRMAVCRRLYDYVSSIVPAPSVDERLRLGILRQLARKAAEERQGRSLTARAGEGSQGPGPLVKLDVPA